MFEVDAEVDGGDAGDEGGNIPRWELGQTE
jgi:hypothetical protein